MRVDAIDHLHLIVPDLEKAKALFSALIGGEFIGPYGGEPWNAHAVWYNRGSMEIFEPIDLGKPVLGGHSSRRRGIFGMAFRVPDLDVSIPRAEALGFKVWSRFGSEDSGFGKMIVQAQFDPADTFGTILELAQRQLPDDPLYSAFTEVIDHVEFYVHDLSRAVDLFASLTGHAFSTPVMDQDYQALSTRNDLGVKLTQPASAGSPVAHSLSVLGEGIRALALVTSDLDSAIAKAQGAGLHLAQRSAEQAVFQPADFIGLVIRLVTPQATSTSGIPG